MAHGLDKYLGSSIASQETIQAIVGNMMQQAFAERDAQLQQIVNQVAAKLQQLEAAIGQVALAAQQTKLSPFEVALKALTHCTKDNEGLAPDAEGRCYDKSFAVIERWLDAALATSATGDGQPGGVAQAARSEEAPAPEGDDGDGESAPVDQEEEEPAENR